MTKSKGERVPPNVRLSIIEDLRAHLIGLGNGKFRYVSNASDSTIATEYKVSVWTVSNIRRQFYGSIINDDGDNETPMGRVWTHIHALEAEVIALKQKFADWKM